MNQEEGVQPLDTQDETRRIKNGEMLPRSAPRRTVELTCGMSNQALTIRSFAETIFGSFSKFETPKFLFLIVIPSRHSTERSSPTIQFWPK